MNRFERHYRFLAFLKRSRFSVILSLLFLMLMLAGIHSVNRTTSAKRMESLQNAIERSVVQCYAVEGTYPPSLTYLKEHYGLSYDENEFFVDYQAIGSNMLPDITIIPINGGSYDDAK